MMVPSGPSTPVGGTQSVSPSILRSNTGVIGGGQGVSVSSQPPFSSLVSPRTQFNNNSNMALLGNMPNVSSLLSQSFGNGPLSTLGLSNASVNLQQRGSGGATDMMGSAEPDPLSFASAAQASGQHFQNSSANQMGLDGLQPQQRTEASQNFHQQFSLPHSQQQQLRGGLGNMAAVKLEQQTGTSDQNVPPQQLQSFRNLNSVKLEPQMQSMAALGPVKIESHQQSDPGLFMQQQQQHQHQQFLHLSRQSSQAAAQLNLLQQQRMIQMQQQQQQHQILKSPPQQRLQQQQLQQQALSFRPQVKTPYEPGMCARRLTHYMYHQKHRPSDNNIEFWRKFVAEYFAPHAKKRWCVSLYGSGRQTTGVFPQDVWHCEICNRKPGRGFETTVEVLPRLYKIKYDSGTLEELLYVDMPREYQNASGQIVLDYAKAIQESVFEQLRVVRDGQLRIVFSSDLKICSWEFCARRHEELIPRRLIIPQVSHLGQVAQKYQAATQNGSSSPSTQELQNSCNLFVASARQLAKALEVPLVNDLGYTKRYVRCLQIAEVVNCMKDLIDYSRETGTGPMESLVNFPRRTSNNSSCLPAQATMQPEEQQAAAQNSNHDDQTSNRGPVVQLASRNNGVTSVNNSLTASPSTASTAAAVGIQNTVNCRQENALGGVNTPYGCGNTVQIPSASSSNSLSQSQANPTSPFPSSSPASNNTAPSQPTTHMNSNLPVNLSTMQQLSQTNEGDPNGSQHSMQQILQEMLSTQLSNVGSLGSDMKGPNGIMPGLNGGSCLVGNGIASNTAIAGTNFGNMGAPGPSSTVGGIRAAIMNNAIALNGRVGMNPLVQDPIILSHQQQDLGDRLMSSGLGAVNNFNNLQFDWKGSP